MITLAKAEFEKLPLYQGMLHYSYNDTLYKKCRSTDNKKTANYLSYLQDLTPIEGLVLPYDLLSDDTIYGFEMPYIPQSQNIEDYLHTSAFDINTIAIIQKIFEVLQRIHNYIILGDVRNSNILLTQSSAFFVDVDGGKPASNPDILETFYKIIIDREILFETKLSDIIKAFICAMSLYYKADIESFILHKDILELLAILKHINANGELIKYLEYLINCAKRGQDQGITYFNANLTMPAGEETSRLRRIIARGENR